MKYSFRCELRGLVRFRFCNLDRQHPYLQVQIFREIIYVEFVMGAPLHALDLADDLKDSEYSSVID